MAPTAPARTPRQRQSTGSEIEHPIRYQVGPWYAGSGGMRPLSPSSGELARRPLSSELSELWFPSSSSCRSTQRPLLPPLQLPAPAPPFPVAARDLWLKEDFNPEKILLPPLEPMPPSSVATSGPGRRRRKRRGLADVRRMLTCLLRRAVRGGPKAPSPALRWLLSTVRAAWPEPRPLRCSAGPRGVLGGGEHGERGDSMPMRPDSSPGLLRRRYSVPETVMRRYRVAQQRAEGEEASSGPGSACTAPERAGPRRRERDLMRRSALLRRLWGRVPPAPCCRRCRAQLTVGHSRSLDTSHADLRRVDPPHVPAAGSPHRPPLSTSSCEVFEITVTGSSGGGVQPVRPSRTLNIDEYVSSVLVESLNSLGDRLDGVASRLHGDSKVSVLEKQIKVKLQSTGVNTLVHLSPTSNNQIIFGNEEICDGPPATERDGTGSPSATRTRDLDVLHQIQKLFREQSPDSDRCAAGAASSVFHRELLNTSSADVPPGEGSALGLRPLGAIGAGNYFTQSERGAPVPRFTALPHTASMEVNTSSSDEAEFPGSECTSLVDSLDDPNSPRLALPGRALTGYRPDLARSTVAVLDLLPEQTHDVQPVRPKEKCESFFIGIEDGACERDDPSLSVADALPDRIKRRLQRRHCRRKQRMESACRGRRYEESACRGQPVRRQFRDALPARTRRDTERACVAVIEALIDDVISKVVQVEYKCTRIERGPVEDATVTDLWKKTRIKRTQSDSEMMEETPASRTPLGCDRTVGDGNATKVHQICGKLSVVTGPAILPGDVRPRRLYQKSEIRKGDNCVEILEILDNETGNRSPDELGAGDATRSGRKSRIPVPVHDGLRPLGRMPPAVRRCGIRDSQNAPPSPPVRRASLPPARPRSGSVRFQHMFDVIPEERSLSVESSLEEHAPATRSVATSPLAWPPAAPSRRTDGHGTGRRACDRIQRAHPPGLREETTRSVARPSPSLVTAQPTNGGTLKCIQIDGSRGRSQTKSIRAKLPSRGEKPTKAAPSSRSMSTDASSGTGPCQSSGRPSEEGKDFDGHDCSTSGESALCSLAPRWLTARRRRRRTASPGASEPGRRRAENGAGRWSVTVAGSCHATLPADVEMRLRFPRCEQRKPRCRARRAVDELQCACAASPTPPPLLEPRRTALTLTMQKEARDSSFVASKSTRKSTEPLPDMETYGSSRSKTKSSVKTRLRRACSPGCLAAGEPGALSVWGSAIVPELKPRAPSMSERDVTRRCLRW